MSLILPLIPLGTIILWVTTAVSSTVPRISPASTESPTLATFLNSHFFSLFKGFTITPLFKKSPASSLSPTRGLWIPSNICSIIPGPSSTESGAPVV